MSNIKKKSLIFLLFILLIFIMSSLVYASETVVEEKNSIFNWISSWISKLAEVFVYKHGTDSETDKEYGLDENGTTVLIKQPSQGYIADDGNLQKPGSVEVSRNIEDKTEHWLITES